MTALDSAAVGLIFSMEVCDEIPLSGPYFVNMAQLNVCNKTEERWTFLRVKTEEDEEESIKKIDLDFRLSLLTFDS